MKRVLLLMCLTVAASGSVEPNAPRAYLGVAVDPRPLSQLLVLHLGLKPGQGLRVQNLQKGSPADRAGLERDDLIVTLDQRPVTGFRGFSETISRHRIGQVISLGIVHRGQMRQIEIQLETRPAEYRPKYDPEPGTRPGSLPGRIYRFEPGKDQWIEITPKDLDAAAQETLNHVDRYLDQLKAFPDSPRPLRDQDRQRLEQLEAELKRLRQRLAKLETGH